MKVALINMPFSSLYLPSTGISLLKAGLEKENVSCDIYYLNLLFASIVSQELYDLDENHTYVGSMGDWIFSQSLYGQDNYEEYKQYLNDHELFINMTFNEKEQLFDKLKKVKHSVEPFMDQVLKEIPWYTYDVIVFTAVSGQTTASISLAQKLKEHYPSKLIVFGGPNCEGEMGDAILDTFPFIDAVCSGEGDISFVNFIKQLKDKELKQCHSVGINLQTKYTEGKKVSTFSPHVHNMNDLPYPNYDDYFAQFEKYNLKKNREQILFIETSRGCWWGAKSHCKFCGLNGSTINYRSKSADRALEDILFLHERYHSYTKKFMAVDTIMEMSYFRDFLPSLREKNLDMSLFYETTANLKREQVKMLRDANIRSIQVGIESLITSVLQLMGKGITMLQNIQLLKWCKEYGVKPFWNYLYGFPNENEKEYKYAADTIRTLTHLEPPMACSCIRLERFSPYYNNAEEFGIVNVRPAAAYSYVYQTEEQETLMKLAYHFEFDYKNGLSPHSYTRDLVHEVRVWRKEHSKSDFFSIDLSDNIVLADLRPINCNKNIFTLSGVEKVIYQMCDSMCSLNHIMDFLKEKKIHASKKEVISRLNRFISEKLMLTENGFYLNLSIPLGEYSPNKEVLEQLLEISKGTSLMKGGMLNETKAI